MLLQWLNRRRERKQLVALEADRFIATHGKRAYWQAKDRLRGEPSFREIFNEIAKRQRKDWVDTSTRYLKE